MIYLILRNTHLSDCESIAVCSQDVCQSCKSHTSIVQRFTQVTPELAIQFAGDGGPVREG